MNGRVVSTEIGVIRACAWAGAVIATCGRGEETGECRTVVFGLVLSLKNTVADNLYVYAVYEFHFMQFFSCYYIINYLYNKPKH